MYNSAVKLWTRHLWYVPLAGIAVLLISTFRFYASSNFWLGFRLFGTNALTYHELAWMIHTVNTALAYLVLVRITGSRPGAAVGAMLFASQAVFEDIYWNLMLFDTGIRCQVWVIGFVVLLILMALFKMHRALFFHSWVCITFLPMIFLSNHRLPVYWYILFLGVCGIAALLVREIVRWLQQRIPSEAAGIAASLCFLVLCQVTLRLQALPDIGQLASRIQS